MRTRCIVALAALTLASTVTACGEKDPSPPPPTAQRSDEAIVAEFNTEFGAVFAAAAACQDDRTAACLERAFAEDPAAALASTSLHTEGWADVWRQAKSFTKTKICQAFHFVMPWAQRFSGALRLYFFMGASGGGGFGGTAGGGEEIVWELNQHQFAAFAYESQGLGNVLGGGGSIYQGVGVSARGGTVTSSWSGTFVSAQASLDIPETEFGLFLGSFSGLPVYDPLRVQGMVWGASAGVNLLNPAVGINLGRSYYTPHDDDTKRLSFNGYFGQIEGSPGGLYLGYRNSKVLGSSRLGPGMMQSLHVMLVGMTDMQIMAGAIALGIDLLNASGMSLADWCSGIASTPCGGGDPTTASLHPTCFGADDTDTGSSDSDPPPGPVSCEADADCGSGAVCTSDSLGIACCRQSFSEPNATPCYSDDDCSAGMVCSRGAQSDDPSATFTCIDPEAHPCVYGKP